jgi:hypothetical protein
VRRRGAVGHHAVHHRDMFQVLGWAAMAMTGLEISMGVRTVVASWRRGAR